MAQRTVGGIVPESDSHDSMVRAAGGPSVQNTLDMTVRQPPARMKGHHRRSWVSEWCAIKGMTRNSKVPCEGIPGGIFLTLPPI